MKVSYKGDYAFKTLLELALNYNKGVLSIQELAKKGDIPEKFLEQVLLILKKGGFVDSKRGVSGGYFLAKSPGSITVGDVIRFIEGPVEPIACAGKKDYVGCKDFKSCILRDIWSQVYTATALVIDTITFAELVRRSEARKKEKGEYTYHI
ncbi:MAG: Rrf2 family transcriptional regulator [Candidatus Omnitrophica bacterium]|nr:Rrf2 family transcriptional regulator [Candidatus Omnitrophota bacterium]